MVAWKVEGAGKVGVVGNGGSCMENTRSTLFQLFGHSMQAQIFFTNDVYFSKGITYCSNFRRADWDPGQKCYIYKRDAVPYASKHQYTAIQKESRQVVIRDASERGNKT